MATTTNFGWETPDDTDLVKDGALAMRTLGNAIDASLVDLKGGTTGQVLSKNSNTDMDFTWVTSDDADAIQNSIVDAKGDLISATADNTPARLAVGESGSILLADSAASVGLRYQEPKAGNPVINSSFQVWQRGTSVSVAAATTAYTADRWLLSTGANAAYTVSRQTTGDTTNLPNIQYCARIQRNSGQTGANQQGLYHMFETVNSIPFAGKTVTVSFYARKGADFSPTSSNIVFALYTGTGTDQNLATSGYTGQAAPGSVTASLTTTWTRYSFTATIAATCTELSLFSYWTTVGTASTNDYFEMTGVQLEVGSVATPFKTQGVTLAGELAACQRYYYRASAGSNNTAIIGLGFVTATTTTARAQLVLPSTMRTNPSSVDFSTLRVLDSGFASGTVSTVTLLSGEQGQNMAFLELGLASGLTAHRPAWLSCNGSGGYLGVSAEL